MATLAIGGLFTLDFGCIAIIVTAFTTRYFVLTA